MALIATEALELAPREALVIDIMMELDNAIEGAEKVSTYALARQIVDLVGERMISAKPRVRVPARSLACCDVASSSGGGQSPT